MKKTKGIFIALLAASILIGGMLLVVLCDYVDIDKGKVDFENKTITVDIRYWINSDICHTEWNKVIPICSLDSLKTIEKVKLNTMKADYKKLRKMCK